MKNLIITEEEKNQILSKHKRSVLNEQDEEIKKYQKALNNVWTNVKIKEDGVIGPETIKYIKLFQQQNDLNVSGQLDNETKIKLSRLLDGGEVEKSWDKVKDLKMELLKTLKTSIGRFESDPNIDLCDIMTQLHFDLTGFYNNPYVRKKGWDPRNCTNFSQLDNLMKEN